MALALKKQEYYTYEDYYAWDTDERYELIDGVPYMMAPAPSVGHQGIVGFLYARIRDFLKDKPCKVYISPIDVRLNADAEDDTVVQPDVLVVCDKNKIDERGIKGAPDLVIEVISASSKQYDSGAKLDRYLCAGVRECWIVNPQDNVIRTYTKSNGKESMEVYGEQDTVPCTVLQGLEISAEEIFEAGMI